MSEAKFTKAPWKIQDDGYGLIGVLFRKGYGVLVGHKDNESISNAHLIAAAPEMYEYIDGLYKTIGLNGGVIELDEYDFDILGKLLAKARGEQNA